MMPRLPDRDRDTSPAFVGSEVYVNRCEQKAEGEQNLLTYVLLIQDKRYCVYLSLSIPKKSKSLSLHSALSYNTVSQNNGLRVKQTRRD